MTKILNILKKPGQEERFYNAYKTSLKIDWNPDNWQKN